MNMANTGGKAASAREIVRRAGERKTIIPAFNIPYLPMMGPVAQAVKDEDAVAMIQVARLEWEKFESQSLEAVAEEYDRQRIPGHTLLHLDHVPVIDEDGERVDYLPIFRRALRAGYQSVMIDASRLPLEENIACTAEVAAVAAPEGIAVEAELGAVMGHEGSGLDIGYEELFASKKGFTDPAEAARFAAETGCDWLSVAAGSIHGAIAEQTRHLKKPDARLDIEHIKALSLAVKGLPLVLHGGSGIGQEYILAAVESGVAKINIATEIRQPYERALLERPGDIGYAEEQVYQKTRWILRDFLRISGSRELLALEKG